MHMHKLLGLAVGLSLLVPSLAFASVGITLQGGAVTVQQGHSYQEPGYSAFSSVDGDITGLVGVSGFSSAVGTHTLTYSVTDSALDSAFAFRSVTIMGGGEMPFCSGPMAPGWQSGVDGGGCGGTGTVIAAGTADCPYFMASGCLKR